MTDKDKRKLLQALYDKEAAPDETDKFSDFWKGYKAGMQDAREIIEEFGRPTEDVLG